MARIIYVEDEPEWREFARDALAGAGHEVDFAGNFREAISLIQRNGYDLALVDLNLGGADVRLGGGILYLLRTEYPDTRRIVVTGDPPSGSLRTNILDKYDVTDFIIKTRTSVPDLRRVVTEALAGAGSAAAMPDPDIEQAQAQVRQRYQDWHEPVARIIRSKVREAQDQARNAGRLRNESGHPVSGSLKDWLELQQRFTRSAADFERSLAESRSQQDVASASEQLNRMITEFASEIDGMESGR
jgi:CheY-like chemotaxis protein